MVKLLHVNPSAVGPAALALGRIGTGDLTILDDRV
jgi:hypothetical protein